MALAEESLDRVLDAVGEVQHIGLILGRLALSPMSPVPQTEPLEEHHRSARASLVWRVARVEPVAIKMRKLGASRLDSRIDVARNFAHQALNAGVQPVHLVASTDAPPVFRKDPLGDRRAETRTTRSCWVRRAAASTKRVGSLRNRARSNTRPDHRMAAKGPGRRSIAWCRAPSPTFDLTAGQRRR